MAGLGDRPLSANVPGEQPKVPRRYSTRVLHNLCSAGLVHSHLGPGGGLELICVTNKLTNPDVINTVEPIARIKKCPLGLKSHTRLCSLPAELDRAYQAMEKAFTAVTI